LTGSNVAHQHQATPTDSVFGGQLGGAVAALVR
jgi:hypothetical protein